MENYRQQLTHIVQEKLSNNRKEAENLCKQIIGQLQQTHSPEDLTDCISFLFTKACDLCKESRLKEGVVLRKIIEQFKKDIPLSLYIKLSYDFLNYYSCGLRDTGFLLKAKLISKNALDMAKNFPLLEKSDSYMNTCAVLSAMGKHTKATEYAKLALESINKELYFIKKTQNTKRIKEKYIKICIANFNLAVEEEINKNTVSALIYYENCLRIIEMNDISKEILKNKVEKSIKRVKKELKLMKMKQIEIRIRSALMLKGGVKISTPDIYSNSRAQIHTSFQDLISTEKSKMISRINPAISSAHINKKILDKKPTRMVFRNPEKSKSQVQTMETHIDSEQLVTVEPFDAKKKFVNSVIKIQAFVRGFLKRLKFIWLKKLKPQADFRKFKLMKGEICLIRISSSKVSINITAIFKEEIFSLVLSEQLGYWEIYENLYIENGHLIVKPVILNAKHVLNSEIQIKEQIFEIEYSMIGKKLIIKLKTPDTEMIKEIAIHFEYNKALPLYILEKIQPKLKIFNSCLVISDFESILKGFIFLNHTLTLISILKSETCLEYYSDSISLYTSEIENNSEFPEIIQLKSKFNKSSNTLIYKKRSPNKIKLVYKEKMLLSNNYEYFVSVFQITDKNAWYYFSAEFQDAPELTGISYLKLDLKKMFGFNLVEKNIQSIVKKIIIVNQVLDLKSTVSDLPNLSFSLEIDKVVVKIQAVYRGNRTRDILKLQRCKNEVLVSNYSILDEKLVTIRLFKVDSGYLVEVIKHSELKDFYFFIKDPLEFVTIFYRYSHVNLLLRLIKTSDIPSINSISGRNLKFIECEYLTEESSAIAKAIHKPQPKIVIVGLVLPNKSIIVKVFDYYNKAIYSKKYPLSSILELIGRFEIESFLSSIRIVDGNISHTMNVLLRSNTSITSIHDQVVYRTCKKIMEILFQVTVYIEGSNLKFVYKRGSNMGLGIHFIIPLKVAFESSGFSESLLIPMANFYIKKLLVMRDDEIVLSNSHEKLNIEKIISKIQAAYRSYRARKQIKDFSFMRLIIKLKKSEKDKIFTILLYDKVKEYALFAVYFSEVYRKIIPKSRGDTPESIIKAHIGNLFIKTMRSPKVRSNTLMFANKLKNFFAEPITKKLILWKGNGLIDSQAISLIITDLSTCEEFECEVEGNKSSFEVSSGFLPKNNKIFNKLEISENFQVDLRISPKKIVFFATKELSGHSCRIYLLTKTKKFLIIVQMEKARKYFIKQIGKKVDMVNLIQKLEIFKESGHYSLSI